MQITNNSICTHSEDLLSGIFVIVLRYTSRRTYNCIHLEDLLFKLIVIVIEVQIPKLITHNCNHSEDLLSEVVVIVIEGKIAKKL